MKSFLKKMNRGVALAIVLLAGLIIFFIADNAVFAKEEPMLKDWLEEYLQECEKVNLLPEEYREAGANVPDEVIEAKTQELKDFVEKYFTEFKRYDNAYYTSAKKQMNLLADAMFKENKSTGNTIQDVQFSLVVINGVRKQATNAVLLHFRVNVNITASPQARFVEIARPGWNAIPIMGRTTGSTNEVQEMTNVYQTAVTLFKVGGVWKIAEVQGGSYINGGGGNVEYSYSYGG